MWQNILSDPEKLTYCDQVMPCVIIELSVLVQVIACRLLSAKSLPEAMVTFCQLDSLEQTVKKFEMSYTIFDSMKCIWQGHLQNVSHLVLGLSVLRHSITCHIIHIT